MEIVPTAMMADPDTDTALAPSKPRRTKARVEGVEPVAFVPEAPPARKDLAVPARRDDHGLRRRSVQLARLTMLLFADLCGVLVAFLASLQAANILHGLVQTDNGPIRITELELSPIVLFVTPLAIVWALSAISGHYTRRRPFWHEMRDIARFTLYTAAIIILVLFLTKGHFSRLWMGGFLVGLTALLPIARLCARRAMLGLGIWHRATVIIGGPQSAANAARTFASDPYLGYRSIEHIALDETARLETIAEAFERRDPTVFGSGNVPVELPHLVFAPDDLAELTRHKALFDRLMSALPTMTFVPPMAGLPLYGAEALGVFTKDLLLLRFHNNLAKPAARAG